MKSILQYTKGDSSQTTPNATTKHYYYYYYYSYHHHPHPHSCLVQVTDNGPWLPECNLSTHLSKHCFSLPIYYAQYLLVIFIYCLNTSSFRFVYCFWCDSPPVGHGLLISEVHRSHTQRHITDGRTPLDE